MKPTFEDAISLAAQKHRGQFDKAGAPYILHPLRVMGNLGPNASENERIAGLLHDVVEDCQVSFEDLRDLGYCDEVIAAIDALTKRDDEKGDYMRAMRRVSQNSIARRVKIADLTDNMDLSRLATTTEEDLARLEKYRAAKAYLESIG